MFFICVFVFLEYCMINIFIYFYFPFNIYIIYFHYFLSYQI